MSTTVARIRFYPLIYANSTTMTTSDGVNFTSAVTTAGSSVSSIFLSYKDDGGWDWYVSADNGVTYTLATNDAITRLSVAGTQIIVKAVAITASALSALPILNTYVLFYGAGAGDA